MSLNRSLRNDSSFNGRTSPPVGGSGSARGSQLNRRGPEEFRGSSPPLSGSALANRSPPNRRAASDIRTSSPPLPGPGSARGSQLNRRGPEEFRSSSPPLSGSALARRSPTNRRAADDIRSSSPPLSGSTLAKNSPLTRRGADDFRTSSPAAGGSGFGRGSQFTRRPIEETRSSSPHFTGSGVTKGNPSSRLALDGPRSSSPTIKFTDEDIKFHRTVFERCVAPERKSIGNREKFTQALNYVGYDLLKDRIDDLWSQNDGTITFSIFQRILQEEKPIDERTLEEAFQTLYNKDRKGNGNLIDYDQFRRDMVQKGDRFSEDEFEAIRFYLGTEHGKIDFKQLAKTVEGSKYDSRRKILVEKREQERAELERSSTQLNSPKPTRNNYRSSENLQIRIEGSLKKLPIPPRMPNVQMKGAFFCEYFDTPGNVLYFSIGYAFEIKRDMPLWITIEPKISPYHKDTSFSQLDIRLLLFENLRGSSQKRLIQISTDRVENKTYIHMEKLPSGSYEIVPVTFGGVLKPRSREVHERPCNKKLRKKKSHDDLEMSSDYRDALSYVFDVFDFDDNKQLDRNEYNLWTKRTTDEEINDEDWNAVRESAKLDVEENLSKKKFLELNEYEVKDPETTENDLFNGLKAIGFNYALEIDMMCQFYLTIYANDRPPHLSPTSYVEVSEIKKGLIKFLRNKAQRIKLNDPGVHCFQYTDDYGSIIFADNRNSSDVRLSVQVSLSKNAALTLPIEARKPPVIHLKPESSKILFFAHKLEIQQSTELEAKIEVL